MAVVDWFAPGKPLQSFLIPEIRRATGLHREDLLAAKAWAPVEFPEGGARRLNALELAAMRLWFATPDGRAEFEEFAFDVDLLLKRLGKNPNPEDAPLEDGRILFGSLS